MSEAMNELLMARLIEELKEINSNLSDISTSLSNLERNLQECTVDYCGNHFLRVAGSFASH